MDVLQFAIDIHSICIFVITAVHIYSRERKVPVDLFQIMKRLVN